MIELKETKMKNEIVERIKSIISRYGTFTPDEVEMSNPVIETVSDECHKLAEEFQENCVLAVTYKKTDNGFLDTIDELISYEDLEQDVLEEILILCEAHETQSIQTDIYWRKSENSD